LDNLAFVKCMQELYLDSDSRERERERERGRERYLKGSQCDILKAREKEKKREREREIVRFQQQK
jgi:hypothetical protein